MKKIFAFLLILIASVSLLTVVSAADVSIESLTFHIPDGYSEDVSAADTFNDGLFDHNYKLFLNNDKNISIEVLTIPSSAGLEMGSLNPDDGEVSKTIASKSGLLTSYENECCFRYMDGDIQVIIYAPDEATIEEVIK